MAEVNQLLGSWQIMPVAPRPRNWPLLQYRGGTHHNNYVPRLFLKHVRIFVFSITMLNQVVQKQMIFWSPIPSFPVRFILTATSKLLTSFWQADLSEYLGSWKGLLMQQLVTENCNYLYVCLVLYPSITLSMYCTAIPNMDKMSSLHWHLQRPSPSPSVWDI